MQRKCPDFKRIPQTNFIVDGFTYASKSLTENYFLTHFHSDHWGGITRDWSAGTIYCSLPTANLVHNQLGVEREYLHPLGLNTPVTIESNGRPVTVTLFDANHCPGMQFYYLCRYPVLTRHALTSNEKHNSYSTLFVPIKGLSCSFFKLESAVSSM